MYEVEAPNGLEGVVVRVKAGTMTMYDKCFQPALGKLNWEVMSGSNKILPRVMIPKTLESLYPNVPKRVPLMTFIWTELMGRPLPPNHVVVSVSCEPYDVRAENINRKCSNVAALLKKAIGVMHASMGEDAFNAANDKYQRLMAEYHDAYAAVMA
jgi:hypothetical protein